MSEKVKTFTIELKDIDGKDDETTETTEDTTESTDSTSESSTDTTGTEQSTENTTENTAVSDSGITTDNTVTIAAPVGVSVYVDGDYVGISPITFSKVTGIHTITLYKSGYLIKSYTINETDDGEDKVYSYPSLTTLLDIVE